MTAIIHPDAPVDRMARGLEALKPKASLAFAPTAPAVARAGFATAAVLALTSEEESPRLRRRRTVALCVVGALLGASRYEGFFLIGLVCLALVVRRQLWRAAVKPRQLAIATSTGASARDVRIELAMMMPAEAC